MSKLWRVICPIRQYNDKLILQCNSYRKGHTHLVWYNTLNEANKRESEILASVVTVTGLEEGEYAFYTRNDESTSIKTYIQILRETPVESVKRIEQYIDTINQHHKDALKVLGERLVVNPDLRPMDVLISLYKALVSPSADKQKSYFQLIVIAQYCANNRSFHMNKDNEAPVCVNNTPQVSIDVGSMITKIITHKLINNKKQYHSTINTEFKPSYDLLFQDNFTYIIDAYVGSDLVGVYMHFSGDSTTKKWLWEDQCKTTNKMIDIREQSIEIPASLLSFTEEEQQRLLIEREKNPFDELIARPQLSISKKEIEISISDNALLSMLGKFYVVAKEPDQLFAAGFDRVEEIKRPIVTMGKSKHLLADTEDYYFYIQDESKRLVSKIELLSLAGTDYDEYKESCRQLELYNYAKRLMSLIDYRIPAASEAVNELLEAAKSNTDVNTANVYKYLIGNLASNKHLSYLNGAVNAIMEDRIGNGVFSQNFFQNGIKLDNAIDKLVYPPKESKYILQVDSFSINSSDVNTYYYESGIGAIEVQSRGADCFIYQAIDKQSYRRSGYVFVNTSKYSSCITNWNVDIEVI